MGLPPDFLVCLEAAVEFDHSNLFAVDKILDEFEVAARNGRGVSIFGWWLWFGGDLIYGNSRHARIIAPV
ncbi:hypothetical protein ACFLYV_00035 [Chloroflexota bacterium]